MGLRNLGIAAIFLGADFRSAWSARRAAQVARKTEAQLQHCIERRFHASVAETFRRADSPLSRVVQCRFWSSVARERLVRPDRPPRTRSGASGALAWCACTAQGFVHGRNGGTAGSLTSTAGAPCVEACQPRLRLMVNTRRLIDPPRPAPRPTTHLPRNPTLSAQSLIFDQSLPGAHGVKAALFGVVCWMAEKQPQACALMEDQILPEQLLNRVQIFDYTIAAVCGLHAGGEFVSSPCGAESQTSWVSGTPNAERFMNTQDVARFRRCLPRPPPPRRVRLPWSGRGPWIHRGESTSLCRSTAARARGFRVRPVLIRG